MRIGKFLPLLALAVAGCQTSGGMSSSRDGELAPGREIYFGKCIKCHLPEPVQNYSAAQWREIVRDMAPEAKLTPAEEAALLHYVVSECTAL